MRGAVSFENRAAHHGQTPRGQCMGAHAGTESGSQKKKARMRRTVRYGRADDECSDTAEPAPALNLGVRLS